jgi:primosomal protein N' (replication factor Y) (superfamily II helicase)
VDVCVAVPKLALNRPFTYLLPEGSDAGTGSLVSVPFHGRTVRGWILGPASDVPEGRLLAVRKVRSSVRFFDPSMLELLRWVSHRYLAPLSTVIERSHPPRVVGEEQGAEDVDEPRLRVGAISPASRTVLARYGGDVVLEAAGATTWLRPLPTDESAVCVAAVEATVDSGRRALVLVAEADPVPQVARSVLEAFGDRAVAFLGGDDRARYRAWLDIRRGRFAVVVATRPGVFAPLGRLGLMWISREVHPGHREDRSPYYHVREVASARARLSGAACVVASLSPSVETAAAVRAGSVDVARPDRSAERAAAPLVETTPPEAEDRSSRLGALLRATKGAALIASRRGYGVARVCRSCRNPAACATCRGPITVERGAARCAVCGSEGVCSSCGGRSFGVERGGAERVAEWAARMAPIPVAIDQGTDPVTPGPGRVVVGTGATVKDVGELRLDLVAILDPDRALARAGVHAGERALATWMEAATWAGPRGHGGRVLVQTRHPGTPAVQGLTRWEPLPFLLDEADRRAAAGLPPGHPVFRLTTTRPIDEELLEAGATTALSVPAAGGTLCLVAVSPERFDGLHAQVMRQVADGTVTRVEAEPQL